MPMDPNEFSGRLRDAVDLYDRKGAAALCDELVRDLRSREDAYPVDAALADLSTLRNKRYFDLMTRVADAHLRAGADAPGIRRQFAQSLLDQGNVSGGLAVLQGMLAQGGLSAKDEAEVRGLIGRAYKQIYVDAGDPKPRHNQDALLRSFDSYHGIYAKDTERHVWHGINAAALMARAARDGIDAGGRPGAGEIAAGVRDTIVARVAAKEATLWDLATLAEAHVALGDRSQAARTLQDYVQHPAADAFELGGTYRQFQEVWRLDEGEDDERVLLDLLRGALLRKDGGAFERTPQQLQADVREAPARRKDLEAILGTDAGKTHTWLMDCLKRANGVARIRHGQKSGTGFLVRGEAIAPQWEGKQVLVTNNHVIATEPTEKITMKPHQAAVTFDALSGGGVNQPAYKVKDGKVLWESPILELDATCVELDREVEGVEDYPVGDPPFEGEDARVYVIGHPMGGELSFAFQDNKRIEFDEVFLHYRSPTEPGSSGSPLFNDNWELIGLHHAGSQEMPRLDDDMQTYPANEGIRIDAIQDAARKASSR